MFTSTRCICSQLECLPVGILVNGPTRYYSAPKQGLKVTIPARIERGPTDILKALSKTVKRDPTAFHYKYPDDPYFSAVTNRDKRSYALSLESGRKSAKWIFDTYPKLFQDKISEPLIEEFIAKPGLDENAEMTEPMLIDAIKDTKVLDAIKIYENLQKNGISVSEEIKQSLLELTCFYNCSDKEDESLLEFKWFKTDKRENVGNTWLNDGFAEKLFQTMNPDCPLACSAILMGRLKYNHVDKAVELFDSVRKQKMKLSVEVYNAVIKQVPNIVDPTPKKWAYIENIIQEMHELNVHPNLGTLNSILFVFCHSKVYRDLRQSVKKLVKQFADLGIEPSLGSYSYMIPCLCSSDNISSNVETFKRIISDLRKVELTIRHPSDSEFFPSVMYFLARHLKNAECAHLLNNLLSASDNVNFLAGNFAEVMYYKHYLNLIFSQEPIESSMELYRSLVPVVYSPEISVLKVVLEAVKRWENLDIMVEIWKTAKELKVGYFVEVLKAFLDLVNVYKDTDSEEVRKVFLQAANHVLISITSSENEFLLQKFEPLFATNVLTSFIINDDVSNAIKLFKTIQENIKLFEVEPIFVKRLMNFCLAKKKFQEALGCLKYARDKNFVSVTEMAEEALPKFSGISEVEMEFVKSLIQKEEDKNEK